jgi:hypothetical protein
MNKLKHLRGSQAENIWNAAPVLGCCLRDFSKHRRPSQGFDLTADWIPAWNDGIGICRPVGQVAEGYLTFNRLYQHSRVAFGNPSY